MKNFWWFACLIPKFVVSLKLNLLITIFPFLINLLFRSIRRLLFNLAHILRQVRMSQHLADGLNLAHVIPIMICCAPHGRANGLTNGLAVTQQVSQQAFGSQRVEKWIIGFGHRVPDLEHFFQ